MRSVVVILLFGVTGTWTNVSDYDTTLDCLFNNSKDGQTRNFCSHRFNVDRLTRPSQRWDELTFAGIRFPFEMGSWLKDKYEVDSVDWARLRYRPHYDQGTDRCVRVRSPQLDRMITTAFANLWGPFEWIPVPVRSVPFELDSLSVSISC